MKDFLKNLAVSQENNSAHSAIVFKMSGITRGQFRDLVIPTESGESRPTSQQGAQYSWPQAS